MEVKGIRWVGVWTDRMSEMRAFATDVLGLRVEGEDRSDFVELTMADGYAWQHFRAPDGHVYEITADPGATR